MMERPILFSTQMVQAILRGDKTMTRRVIKPQPTLDYHYMTWWDKSTYAWTTCHPLNVKYPNQVHKARCPYRADGEVILWVRETWAPWSEYSISDDDGYRYRADGEEYTDPCETPSGGYPSSCRYHPGCEGCTATGEKIIWYPSIYMPRAAARLFLRVEDVRVERLCDITWQDAKAEGITIEMAHEANDWAPTYNDPDSGGGPDYVAGYKALWDSINQKRGYGWDTNPWVWVVTFKRVDNPALAAKEG